MDITHCVKGLLVDYEWLSVVQLAWNSVAWLTSSDDNGFPGRRFPEMDSLVETWLTLSLKTNRNFFIFTSCTIIGTNWNRCIFCALVRARTECIRQVTSCLILLLNAYLPRKLRLLLKAYFHCFLTPSHPDTWIVLPEPWTLTGSTAVPRSS